LNETWEYIPEGSIARNAKIIGCKWVFKTKMNPDGSKRYKARVVIKGYEQSDYGETYTPVAKLVSFRMMIALAVFHGWELDQMDMVTAFPNPPVEGDVYMELPKGFLEYLTISTTPGHKQGLVKQGSICKLKKALYGLKEAPRLWHAHIDRFLHSLGFTRSASDPNLYIIEIPAAEGGSLFLLLYVDDLLIAC
jgi:hypothetical protein